MKTIPNTDSKLAPAVSVRQVLRRPRYAVRSASGSCALSSKVNQELLSTFLRAHNLEQEIGLFEHASGPKLCENQQGDFGGFDRCPSVSFPGVVLPSRYVACTCREVLLDSIRLRNIVAAKLRDQVCYFDNHQTSEGYFDCQISVEESDGQWLVTVAAVALQGIIGNFYGSCKRDDDVTVFETSESDSNDPAQIQIVSETVFYESLKKWYVDTNKHCKAQIH